MKTFETDARISDDRTLHITIPEEMDLKSGVYHVVIVIDETPIKEKNTQKKEPLKLNVFKLEGWPSDCTFRREDIYEDDGR